MHPRLLFLLPLLVLLPSAAGALTFQTKLEQVQWSVEGDRFECRLSQPIADFGVGVFIRRAGERPVFRVQAGEAWFAEGSALLYAAAAPWHSSHSNLQLGTVTTKQRYVLSNQQQAGRLLTGLLEGRAPMVRHRTLEGRPLEVRLQPAEFANAYRDYLACTENLLPVNYEQIKQASVNFDANSLDLTSQARAKLDVLLEFMQEDPSINRIYLDGHSDNSGDRLLNRDVSRRRALVVKAYMMAKGVEEDRFIVRFHGERYPLKPNNSATNRAANRRVAIRLERIDQEIAEQLEQIDFERD